MLETLVFNDKVVFKQQRYSKLCRQAVVCGVD